MLRYDRQTKPGLVALYDIRPGNGAGPFLQPRSPHGARSLKILECWGGSPWDLGAAVPPRNTHLSHVGHRASMQTILLKSAVIVIHNYFGRDNKCDIK